MKTRTWPYRHADSHDGLSGRRSRLAWILSTRGSALAPLNMSLMRTRQADSPDHKLIHEAREASKHNTAINPLSSLLNANR
jgi:hypothetical protein